MTFVVTNQYSESELPLCLALNVLQMREIKVEINYLVQ